MSILFSIFIHFWAYFVLFTPFHGFFSIFSVVKNSPTNCCRAAVFLFSFVRFYYTRRLTDTIVRMYEKERGAMIPEPGNLLVMARLNFRVKCNNHFRDSAPLGRCLLFYESRHFFLECACSYELYMIKWQAILLRIHTYNGLWDSLLRYSDRIAQVSHLIPFSVDFW